MIYVDLLVVEDLFLNYVILISTGIILNRITKFKKVFLSAVIGIVPLILLFIDVSKFEYNIISFLFSIIMSLISFGYKDIIYTIKNIVIMYFTSVLLAGSIYLINTNYLPDINNYLLNTVILIILAPVISYLYLKILKNIKIINSNYYQVDIYLKDKPKITINGYLDTGNKLIDPYSFKPIILISKQVLKYNPEKYVLVPYNTITGGGILKCFSPEKIYIDGVGFRKKLLIGLIDEVKIENADGILNQKIIERI